MNKNSRICVVGSNGMLGHAVCKQLNSKGYTNIIKCDKAEVDLCNQQETENFFKAKRPEYVFFLAAVAGGIQFKKSYPADMLLKNLQMITNVMDISVKIGCKKMINVCSALIYPSDASIPFKEESAKYINLDEIDTPYSLAKVAGMQLAKFYNQQYKTNYITVVPCNFFGEYAPFEKDKAGVVAALIKRIYDAKLTGQPTVDVWGTGNAHREFLNSQDVADACIFLMENKVEHELINIGRGFEFTIKEVAEMIKDVVGYKGVLYFDSTKPEGRQHMQLDVKRLFNMGWRPNMDLRDSIINTFDWYINNRCNH